VKDLTNSLEREKKRGESRIMEKGRGREEGGRGEGAPSVP